MRVAPDHLGCDAVSDRGKIEITAFLTDAGLKDDLQEKITQFIAEGFAAALFNRLSNFISFLDRIGGDTGMRLFQIPCTACFRMTQGGHDIYQGAQTCFGIRACVGHDGVIL